MKDDSESEHDDSQIPGRIIGNISDSSNYTGPFHNQSEPDSENSTDTWSRNSYINSENNISSLEDETESRDHNVHYFHPYCSLLDLNRSDGIYTEAIVCDTYSEVTSGHNIYVNTENGLNELEKDY